MPALPNATPPHPILPRRLNASELMVADLPSRQTILDPILSTKSLALLYGPRGLGKTFVALGIAWAAAQGGTFLNWTAPRPHRVLYVDGEMAAVDMRERLRLMGSMPLTLEFLLADLHPAGLPDLGYWHGQQVLWQHWGAEKPELLVLDNLASLTGFTRNDPDCWNDIQRWLMALRRLDMSVLVVHHANKRGAQRGTSRREDVLDVVMSLRRPTDYEPRDGARFEIHFEKARGLYGRATDPIEARLETTSLGRRRWTWRPAHIGAVERVARLLGEGLSIKQASHDLRLSHSQIYRLRKQAIELGLLTSAAP